MKLKKFLIYIVCMLVDINVEAMNPGFSQIVNNFSNAQVVDNPIAQVIAADPIAQALLDNAQAGVRRRMACIHSAIIARDQQLPLSELPDEVVREIEGLHRCDRLRELCEGEDIFFAEPPHQTPDFETDKRRRLR